MGTAAPLGVAGDWTGTEGGVPLLDQEAGYLSVLQKFTELPDPALSCLYIVLQ